MNRTQAREKRVITRASCEVAFASVAAWSRSWCQNACAQQPECAHSVSKSEYAVSLVHYSRPLNRQETLGFCKSHDSQFRQRAAFGRANILYRYIAPSLSLWTAPGAVDPHSIYGTVTGLMREHPPECPSVRLAFFIQVTKKVCSRGQHPIYRRGSTGPDRGGRCGS